jgi:hypothetical protein
MNQEFPPRLKQFIEQHIESIPQLETLLLLRREPQRPWTAADVAKALYIAEDAAESLLADFVRRGFAVHVQPDGCYTYRGGGGEFDELVDELAAVYRERRVAVTSLIYSRPLHKVQTFADAFRFGKENPK